jgi:hypothetical protein
VHVPVKPRALAADIYSSEQSAAATGIGGVDIFVSVLF